MRKLNIIFKISYQPLIFLATLINKFNYQPFNYNTYKINSISSSFAPKELYTIIHFPQIMRACFILGVASIIFFYSQVSIFVNVYNDYFNNHLLCYWHYIECYINLVITLNVIHLYITLNKNLHK